MNMFFENDVFYFAGETRKHNDNFKGPIEKR
jgi:hypothetical protein